MCSYCIYTSVVENLYIQKVKRGTKLNIRISENKIKSMKITTKGNLIGSLLKRGILVGKHK